MAETNEEKRPPAVVYHALPEIEDTQRLVIAPEVDMLVDAVMEMANVTTEALQRAVEQFGRRDDPAFLLECKKHFLAALLRERKWKDLPQACFAPLMRLAVYEPDPSFNRGFIEPALRAFGYRRVQEAFLDYLERGTNREKAGAARACYWAWLPLIFDDPRTRGEDFQRVCDEGADLRARRNILLLKTFVESEDRDVRRSIIPGLSLKPSEYPEEFRPLIPEAIHLAHTHPDGYIRHRVEIQLRERGIPTEGSG
jgi:hypothetical protein